MKHLIGPPDEAIHEEALRNELASLSPIHRACEGSGLSLTMHRMAWRPYENLINGELDNRVPRKVTGWLHFFRSGKRPLKVTLELEGDFHEDIRGKVIRVHNPHPAEEDSFKAGETYMEGFSAKQHGQAGDITAGLKLGIWDEALSRRLMAQQEHVWKVRQIPEDKRTGLRRELLNLHRRYIEAKEPFFPYTNYPYIEWYSDDNGRVVLELEPNQVEVIEGNDLPKAKTPGELAQDGLKRSQAFGNFLSETAGQLSRQNRQAGGDGNVGVVVVR